MVILTEDELLLYHYEYADKGILMRRNVAAVADKNMRHIGGRCTWVENGGSKEPIQ